MSAKIHWTPSPAAGVSLAVVVGTVIVSLPDFNSMVDRLTYAVNVNVDGLRVEKVTWADQFRNALNVNGGDVENASSMDYLMHVLTFGWKVRFTGGLTVLRACVVDCFVRLAVAEVRML